MCPFLALIATLFVSRHFQDERDTSTYSCFPVARSSFSFAAVRADCFPGLMHFSLSLYHHHCSLSLVASVVRPFPSEEPLEKFALGSISLFLLTHTLLSFSSLLFLSFCTREPLSTLVVVVYCTCRVENSVRATEKQPLYGELFLPLIRFRGLMNVRTLSERSSSQNVHNTLRAKVCRQTNLSTRGRQRKSLKYIRV